ncbi:MAG TPA: ribonuclease P protein component [Dehalococcoidia bacterium]|nr:ribonuclease P protein component [Dehalococcoidia bacterium]
MPFYQPLRGDDSFTAVFRRGRRQDGSFIAVRALPNERPEIRVGFNIAKKMGGAVDRNRVRRRLRHILKQLDPVAGYDLVLIANQRTRSAPYSQLKSETESLLRAAGVTLQGSDFAS